MIQMLLDDEVVRLKNFSDLISTISFIVETNFKMFQLDRKLSPEIQMQ